MSRWLDPDNDYAYDRTNRPASNHKTAWILEMEAKAAKCLSFQPTTTHEALQGVCRNCQCARYAHSAYALREEAS